MLNQYVKQIIEAKAVQGSARMVGDSVNDQIERMWRIIHSVLKSTSKGWAVFKDLHFGWFVLVPVISSTSAFGEAAAILAWGSVVVLVLVLVSCIVLDAVLGSEAEPVPAQTGRPGTAPFPRVAVAEAPHRARASYEPLQSRWTQAGIKRSGVRRAARVRGSRS